MTQPFRLHGVGLVDQSKPISFTFNGKELQGCAGDTLASALLANGLHHVARSLKYHRPRGILSAGLEEPSALLSVRDGQGKTPNLKATEVVLREGLGVSSQNHWPSLDHDAGALLQTGSRLLSAGFYYKTFMWPRNAWHHHYESTIRRMAGHGTTDPTADPSLYDKRYLNCDILVIGTGGAGLAAAATAAHGGATTVVLEQDFRMGGALLAGDAAAHALALDAEAELKTLSNVTSLTSTLAFGIYDHGMVHAVQMRRDNPCRAIMWKIRARRIVLASGAIERPLVFPGNDRPGIMLASAVRSYIRRFAVKPGQRAVLAIECPDAQAETECRLAEVGIKIAGTVDPGDELIGTRGGKHLSSVAVRRANGHRERLACDLLCVSGGWTAAAHLYAHAGGKLAYRDGLGQIPASPHPVVMPIGGARGTFDKDLAADEGRAAAQQLMGDLKINAPMPANLTEPIPRQSQKIKAGKGKAFVDLQNDVTRGDIIQATYEGYRDVELVKRYVTLGMGTDQGKTSWANGVDEIVSALKIPAATIGHTTFRPPYSPVTIGALVGAEIGQAMHPIRRTPFHHAFEALDCQFQTSGDWLYARYFPKPGEDMHAAITREVRAVRTSLGCVDMSTLGKFDISGKDAHEFLSRLYCNNIATIAPGRLRYGLMLREDGIVFDDGTIACLASNHFLVTATTSNRDSVWRHMQKLAQVDWPDLDVQLTDVSDHWASLAIAGPQARVLLQALSPDFETAREDFPFAAIREGKLGGDLPVRVFSVSFSGELSYEINVPASYAKTLLNRVLTAGAEWDITPYGLETLDVLRIEKGHLSIGTEIDGRRTPADLGLGRMVSNKKDFVGSALLNRVALQSNTRLQLVGLTPVDGRSSIPLGGHITAEPLTNGPQKTQGYLTAAIDSPTMGHSIALAFMTGGLSRTGKTAWVVSPIANTSVEVTISSPHFYDPIGERLHG
ncbi:2Fe-2S iron-sulfur cluster-binding protein [Roseovarius sp. EL26]|uniref:2Fe-2S iron-sulfur cluster-binding protein n=1 Tax=Roseovarius sp. EL26 TaxID=2126672 RepID=UPI000EA35595|nr:2Fe-2S iron-sulfur cluster-binding protein [Roseovarius sp. EL26]